MDSRAGLSGSTIAIEVKSPITVYANNDPIGELTIADTENYALARFKRVMPDGSIASKCKLESYDISSGTIYIGDDIGIIIKTSDVSGAEEYFTFSKSRCESLEPISGDMLPDLNNAREVHQEYYFDDLNSSRLSPRPKMSKDFLSPAERFKRTLAYIAEELSHEE